MGYVAAPIDAFMLCIGRLGGTSLVCAINQHYMFGIVAGGVSTHLIMSPVRNATRVEYLPVSCKVLQLTVLWSIRLKI